MTNDTLTTPRAIAYYIGLQETLDPRAPIALFDLITPIPGHCVGSTVSAQTLRAHGYHVPHNPLVGERVNSTLRVSHNKACT